MKKTFFKELSSTLRQGHVKSPNSAQRIIQEASSPIEVRPRLAFEWETLESPRRLAKTYEFDNRMKLKEFIRELMDYEDQVNHHASITVDYGKVSIEIFTHSINSVTELDYEYAKMADMIFRDVEFYK